MLFAIIVSIFFVDRYRDQARLTITNLASGFSRTYEGPNRIVSDLEMKFNVNSSVFLAGLPSNEKVGSPGSDMFLFVWSVMF